MPWYRIGGTVMHLRMDKRQRKKMAPPCPFYVWDKRIARPDAPAGNLFIEGGVPYEHVLARCLTPTTHLCDWLGCNAPMCERHAQQLVPGFDFCPTHNSQRGLFSRLLPAPQAKNL